MFCGAAHWRAGCPGARYPRAQQRQHDERLSARAAERQQRAVSGGLSPHGHWRASGQERDGLVAEERSAWLGYRPSLPDSLPVIGPSPRYADVYLAFGHGHLGMTQGPLTGRVVADLVAGRDPGFDISPYRPERW